MNIGQKLTTNTPHEFATALRLMQVWFGRDEISSYPLVADTLPEHFTTIAPSGIQGGVVALDNAAPETFLVLPDDPIARLLVPSPLLYPAAIWQGLAIERTADPDLVTLLEFPAGPVPSNPAMVSYGGGRGATKEYGDVAHAPYERTGNQYSLYKLLERSTIPHLHTALSLVDGWYNAFVLERVVYTGVFAGTGSMYRVDVHDAPVSGSYLQSPAAAQDRSPATGGYGLVTTPPNVPAGTGVAWMRPDRVYDLPTLLTETVEDRLGKLYTPRVTMGDVLRDAQPGEVEAALSVLLGHVERMSPNLAGLRKVRVEHKSGNPALQESHRFMVTATQLPYMFIADDGNVFAVHTARGARAPELVAPCGAARLVLDDPSLWAQAALPTPVQPGYRRPAHLEYAGAAVDGWLYMQDFIPAEYLARTPREFDFHE